MKNAVIIHGTKGNPESNWFPWLQKELIALGYSVNVPEMPTPIGQSLINWKDTFKDKVGGFNSDTVLIGHSVGAVFIMRLLEEIDCVISTTILVSPFTGELGIGDYDLLNSSFVKDDFNYAKIKKNGGRLFLLCGDNDPYVPLEQPKNISSGLGVEPIIISGGGHLNSESGYNFFPELLKFL